MNVEHKEYASKGVAGTALGVGIGSLGLQLLGGGLGGLFGGCGFGGCGCNPMMYSTIAEKDAKIAQLSAELDTDRKLIQVWDSLNTKREETDKKVAILEAKNEAMQYIISNITRVVVPNPAVCPGWGATTTTVVTPTAGA